METVGPLIITWRHWSTHHNMQTVGPLTITCRQLVHSSYHADSWSTHHNMQTVGPLTIFLHQKNPNVPMHDFSVICLLLEFSNCSQRQICVSNLKIGKECHQNKHACVWNIEGSWADSSAAVVCYQLVYRESFLLWQILWLTTQNLYEIQLN